MKKLLLSICLCLTCCLIFTTKTNAEEFYYEEVIEEISSFEITRATSTKTAKKTANIKNSSGDVLWSVTVTGTFSYNGSTSTCTSATAYNSYWKIYSHSSSKSGNTASATATAKNYFDGTVISTLKKTVTLTCSPTGTLS